MSIRASLLSGVKPWNPCSQHYISFARKCNASATVWLHLIRRRHNMETISALLDFYAGNPLVTSEFLSEMARHGIQDSFEVIIGDVAFR